MSKNVTIIDVRTRAEFAGGNVNGSINIPLNELADRKDEILSFDRPLIFCCASGGRSAQATSYFQSMNVECENGGSWLDVNYKINQ